MSLHKNPQLFKEIIDEISTSKGYKRGIIEKDYYVTLYLQQLNQNLPELVFRGGTSLSKCYGVIDRFSEDIDVTVNFESKLTEGQRKNIKAAVVKTAAELNMNILNLADTKSGREYNDYKIDFNFVIGTELSNSSKIKMSCALYSSNIPLRKSVSYSLIE